MIIMFLSTNTFSKKREMTMLAAASPSNSRRKENWSAGGRKRWKPGDKGCVQLLKKKIIDFKFDCISF